MKSMLEKITEILEATGEGLLDDVGVDPIAARNVSEEITEMLVSNLHVVVTAMGTIEGLFDDKGNNLGKPDVIDFSKVYICPGCEIPFNGYGFCSCGYNSDEVNLEKILEIRDREGVWGSGV